MFKKIKLDYSSLYPVINDETLYTHYNDHYGKYVDNLNKLIKEDVSLKYILQNIDKYDISKRNEILFNAGGVLNHEIYFDSLTPNTIISSNFKEILTKKYGSYDNFVSEFKLIANKLVGSGYTFLVYNNGNLDIINMSNQENPYTYGMVPLLALDLWEHAYYLQYKSNRSEYINNFFSIINFNKVEARYEKAIQEEK